MKWLRGVIELLFPKFCLGCGRVGVLLCDACWLMVDFLYEQGCPVCFEPSVGGVVHPGCRKARGLDGLWCLTRYRGPIKALVKGLKYSHLTVCSELIEQLFTFYLDRESIYLPQAVLLPVPVHKETLAKRGYNQAEVVAGEVGRCLSLPVVTDLLVKRSRTASQTALNKEQRRVNVKGAFELSIDTPRAKELLEGRAVIVVDDVFTSGATMSEIARVLKKCGASEVWGFALARD